ncbi:splicing regulator SDE2 [Patella vulgata]|uniref:splicing regulator SDE2 n=1 Tax=Patella vulgata TaxID=6465 RepID=UPI0021809656|nr:splicing regulator SDE2 [Patella vulgata]
MGCFYIYGSGRGFVDNVKSKEELLELLFDLEVVETRDVYVTGNGKILSDGEGLVQNYIYHIVPRLVGGKGGFGSMLRAIGAQIEKTTSREACRDLSGRRMRDVNNEKKLKDWLSKQSDREREKEEKRKERMERRRYRPQHKFDDPTYVEQKNKVVEDLEDALQRGLKKAKTTSATVTSETAGCSGVTTKRKATDNGSSHKAKKTKEWLGIDPSLDLSDLDTSDEENGNTQSSSDSNISPDETTQEKAPEESTPVQNPEVDSNDKTMSDKKPDLVTSCKTSPDKKHSLLAALPPPNSEVTTEEKEPLKPINLEEFNSVEDLEKAGLDSLKAALMERGLKCGGTLTQRAERLFSVKGLNADQIDSSLKAKPSKKK